MDDENIIFFSERCNLFIKSRSRHASHRVGRKRDDHVFCLFCHFFGNIPHIGKKIVLRSQRIIVGDGSCHKTSCGKYRVAGIRKKNRVAFIAERHAKMPHSLLASVNRHYHIRGDLYLETLLIIFADSVQKLRDIPEAVFPVIVVHSRFRQSFFYVFRGFEIRSSNAHVINFHSLPFQFHSPVIESGKDFVSKSVQSF